MSRKENRLFEDGDQIFSEAHAKELLNVQSNYNKLLQELNNKLAKQKSDLSIKYLNISKQQTAAQNSKDKATVNQNPQNNQGTAKQTGTVNNAGTPTNAQGNTPTQTVESYPDILNIHELNEEGERMTGKMDWGQHHDMSNWYERENGVEEPTKMEPRKRVKKMTWAIREKIMNLEGEIADEKQNMQHYKEANESPEGAQDEVEEFFAQVGPEASEILNSGGYSDEGEILKALQQAGVTNAKDILNDYYYYYPEFNPSLEKKRKEAEKEMPKIQAKIDKLQAKIDKMETVYESVNESSFLIKNVDPYELQDLKDYLDAENISYSEDEGGETFDFDETELDKEWKDKMDVMGFEDNNPEPETDDILSMDDDDDTESEDITDTDEKIDNEKVFYVKVDDEGEEFVGKIYKLFDEGDWRSKLVDGVSDTFEKMNYDPDWDEVDIIAFLRENYADAELMSEEEFNNHAEEPEAEHVEESFKADDDDEEYRAYSTTRVATFHTDKETGKAIPYSDEDYEKERNDRIAKWKETHKLLKKDDNELDGFEKELTEHKIPTLDEFLSEKENYPSFPKSVLDALKDIDIDRYKYVKKMWNKTDRYKDYVQNSLDNFWSPSRTAKGIILMDS